VTDHIWEFLLEFVDQSESFAHGFEAGRIWQGLIENPNEQNYTIHAANAELMLRISESTGRGLTWTELSDDKWVVVTFAPKLE